MDEKKMRLLFHIACYVMAPVILLYYLGTDLKLYRFSPVIFIILLVLLFGIIIIGAIYKKKDPTFEYKINPLYEKIMAVLIIAEVFFGMNGGK